MENLCKMRIGDINRSAILEEEVLKLLLVIIDPMILNSKSGRISEKLIAKEISDCCKKKANFSLSIQKKKICPDSAFDILQFLDKSHRYESV